MKGIKRYKLPVIKEISSGDVMCSLVAEVYCIVSLKVARTVSSS